MAKCKECFHYEACSAFSKIINAAHDVEKGCEYFKASTNFVEVVRCKDCKHRITQILTDAMCAIMEASMQCTKNISVPMEKGKTMIERIEKMMKNKLVRKITTGVSVALGFGGAIATVVFLCLALFVHWAWAIAIVPGLIGTGIAFGFSEYLDSIW